MSINMRSKLKSCFKTYDVRGQVNKNIDRKICYEIARCFVEVLKANKVVVGRDARESSPIFAEGVINAVANMTKLLPVVIRLEGNRADHARKKLQSSGLNIVSASDFVEAAQQAVVLANKD